MKKSDLKKEKVKSKANHSEEEDAQSDHQNQIKEEENGVKDEVKLENEDGPKRLQNEENADFDDQIKWDYLEHHGVTFPEVYIPKNYPIKYDGKNIKLTPYEQELATYWCQSIGTVWQENQFYKPNFANIFMERFKKQMPEVNDFDKFDFNSIILDQARQKEEKKNIPSEVKKKNKLQKDMRDRLYALAIVDDALQKINNPTIQPPTLFKGRGKHPKAGIIKPRIMPQEVTINTADDAPIPRCDVPGHSWGDVVCKKDSTWLCSYKNEQVNSSSSHKYVFLAANSKFKTVKDRRKYEKARMLKNSIDRIRESYMKMMGDKDLKNRQLGTATYIIDKLALRVGNDKDQDEADTVGCCSLRVQHLKLLPGNQVQFDFLGKDSMRYHNVVTVIPEVWNNIEIFMKKKQQTDQVFDKIDPSVLNDYLKQLLDGLTAKVFRTYNASFTLQNQLNKCQPHLEGLTMDEKFEKYNEANKQVAILCNHQKTVSKKALQSLAKKQRYIAILKENLAELNKHKSHFSAKKDTINRQDLVKDFDGKPVVQKFPSSKQKTVAQIKKLEEKIHKEEKILRQKDNEKDIALGTSKTNYNDPRISVAWCKKNEVKIEKVFPKNLLGKFLWAMYTEAEWEF